MKKLIILSLALFFAGSSFAQKKVYLSLGAGIGFGTASTYDLSETAQKVHPVAFGKAVGVNLHAGFFLNHFMAIDLGVSYKIGLNTKVEPSVDEMGGVKASTNYLTLKFKGNMLELVPGIVFSPEMNGKLRPYIRAGLIIAVMNSMITGIDNNDPGGTGTQHIVAAMKRSGGVGLGGSLAVGADFALSNLLSLYAEIYYDALSYAPKKGKYTKFDLNGVDQLGNMTTEQKEVEYVKDLNGFVPSDGNPNQALKNSYPFNSLGLNIGVKIKF